ALSKCVTIGTVDHAVVIERSVALRTPLIGTRSTSPQRVKSGSGGAAGTAAAAGPAGAAAARRTSSAEMRPRMPDPCTLRMSTPSSRASRLTDGAAGTSWPSPPSAAGAGAAAGLSGAGAAGAGAGRSAAAGAGASRLAGLRGRRRRRCRLVRAPLLHPDQHRADRGLVALGDVHLLDDARHGRGDLDDGLVGLELDERLVLLDLVAGLDQHADDGAGLDPLADFGKPYLGGH